MLVSILIPCFNSLPTIEKTINSVIAQDYKEIEIIIQDDCSLDGTYELVCKKYNHLPFIKIQQNEQNRGMCCNWNILFAKANGVFWLKLDADDYIEPSFISTTLVKALATGADFTGTSYNFVDTEKNKITEVSSHYHLEEGFIENPLKSIFIDYPFHLCFTLLKAEFVKKISPDYFFMDTEVGDAEFQIRAALSKDFKAYFISEKLGFYCFHGNNSSLTPLKQAKSFVYDVVAKHKTDLKRQLGINFNHKMIDNFKIYLKSMVLNRAPWDIKLLYTCIKYISI